MERAVLSSVAQPGNARWVGTGGWSSSQGGDFATRAETALDLHIGEPPWGGPRLLHSIAVAVMRCSCSWRARRASCCGVDERARGLFALCTVVGGATNNVQKGKL